MIALRLLVILFLILGLKVSGLLQLTWFELILPIVVIFTFMSMVYIVHNLVTYVKKLRRLEENHS